jgi:hypothetical protein
MWWLLTLKKFLGQIIQRRSQKTNYLGKIKFNKTKLDVFHNPSFVVLYYVGLNMHDKILLCDMWFNVILIHYA